MKAIKFTLATLAAVFVACAFVPQAQAVMINGVVTFAGGAEFDTDSLATAMQVDEFSDVFVTSRSGDFTGTVSVGDAVVMAMPYIFMPSTFTDDLWSVGGFMYDLDDSIVVLQTADFLLITGSGLISGNGFEPTAGSWSFTSQEPDADGVFSFSAGTGAEGVPEGGTTVALLGLGLAAVELIRRKMLRAA